MSTVSLDPRTLPFTAWADGAIVENGLLPRAWGEQHWKAWAAQAVLIDGTAPDPMPFDDWRSWAIAWVGAQ